jgi:hypothetical protein
VTSWQFVVDCRKTGDRLRKSGKLRILKSPIGKSERMVEIGKIPPESGKLAGMHCDFNAVNVHDHKATLHMCITCNIRATDIVDLLLIFCE